MHALFYQPIGVMHFLLISLLDRHVDWDGLEVLPMSIAISENRQHLTKTAGKLKNRNNLLMKLAGSNWGASANTVWSSALALCYSAAEYCAPV